MFPRERSQPNLQVVLYVRLGQMGAWGFQSENSYELQSGIVKNMRTGGVVTKRVSQHGS